MKVENIHHGKGIRAIRQLRGMKQEVFARELGVTQQNISKMEKKEKLSEEKIEAAAKILQTTTEAIKNFDENGIFQNNLFNEQVNNFNPVDKVVELYERLLKEVKNENIKLRKDIEKLKKAYENKTSSKTSNRISEKGTLTKTA